MDGQSHASLAHVEIWLHAIPLVFGFATMIVGLFLQLFNYGLWDCWIAPYPLGCKESWQNGGETTCERGDNASLYQIVRSFSRLLWTSVMYQTFLIFHFHLWLLPPGSAV